MTPNAARRTPRSGSHLTLVTTDMTEPDAPVASEQPRAKHAAPSVTLPIAGSATVRALMALGAVLSAVGLTIGRADAARHEVQGKPVEAAQPDTSADIPEAPAVPEVVPAARIVSTSAIVRTAPERWEPASKPVATRTYRSAPVPGTGKHRRQGALEHAGTFAAHTPGRHRRVTPQGHGIKPLTSKNMHTGVVIGLPVSNVV
ncbi:hypothetical protein ACUXZZ_45460 (plasmid) [Streptomyces graminifolii]|uniref:hypothetical protein n=1 Tax=Streptomyces graminifolii TaxID=1266771 RepID=UPI00405A4423